MVALWGALKSVLRAGDMVVALCNGIYGDGIAGMAEGLGATVYRVSSDPRQSLDLAAAIAAIQTHRPQLVTAVHCDTPTGLLNDLRGLGAAAHAVDALLYVDFVSSAAGCPVHAAAADELGIDLGLLGSQKALSCVPSLAAVAVSSRAWQVIEQRRYQGYDALLPMRTALARREFPFTHDWHAIAALRVAVAALLSEGLEHVYARHRECAALCRARLESLGLSIFTAESASSPTATAVLIPSGITWTQLDSALRAAGVCVGGSYGPYQGKLFRIGHMGEQARPTQLAAALDVIEEVLRSLGYVPPG